MLNLVLALYAGKRPGDILRALNIMLSEACRKGASDIHFESSEIPKNDRVLFCIYGEYLEYMIVPSDVADEIFKRIKSMANIDVRDYTPPKIGFKKFQRDDLPEFWITAITRTNNDLRENVDLKF